MALSITVPGWQSLVYKLADGKVIELHPGVTNIEDGPEADYILSHPMTEIFESTNKIRINNAVSAGKKDLVFEVVDTEDGDAVPVGDLVNGKTQYRGDVIKNPEAVAEIVEKRTVKTPRSKRNTKAETAEVEA